MPLFISQEHSESAQCRVFSIEDPLIPLEEILGGGPPSDGIPSTDSPIFILAAEADWQFPDSRIIGLDFEGVIPAYPLTILNWHEIVNDTVGEVPVSITFCPLCGNGMAFRRDFDGRVLRLVFPDCCITGTSCFMTGRVNSSGLK